MRICVADAALLRDHLSLQAPTESGEIPGWPSVQATQYVIGLDRPVP